MEPFAVIVLVGVLLFLQGLICRWSHREQINHLRSALEHQREMRRLEEIRAETLSDALFGRTRTRQRSDTKLRN